MRFIEEDFDLIDVSSIEEWINEDQINEVVKYGYDYDDLDDFESEDLVMFGVGGPG